MECVFIFRFWNFVFVCFLGRGVIFDSDLLDDDDDEMGEDLDDYFGLESLESDYFLDDEIFWK